MSSVTAIIVCYLEDSEDIARAVRGLLAENPGPDEIIVVDNSPDARHEAFLAGESIRVIATRENLGFPGAVNVGAAAADGDYLFLLNPDAVAGPDALSRLVDALDQNAGAAIAGAQIMLPDGSVNAGRNPVHMSGLCWSGNYGGAVEGGPPVATLSVSGAAVLIRRSDFLDLGGFNPALFMYFDDTDLCLRARAAGRQVLFCPQARVEHDYVFDKGPGKWTWLEQGRLATVLSNYQSRTIVILLPMLVAVEFAILLAAVGGGWLRPKLAAYRLLWQKRKEIRRWRQRVESMRTVPDRELLPEFAAVFDAPDFDSVPLRLAAAPQRLYRRLVLWLA